jgi:hypothetical protein
VFTMKLNHYHSSFTVIVWTGEINTVPSEYKTMLYHKFICFIFTYVQLVSRLCRRRESVKSIKNKQDGITSETKMIQKTMEKIVQAHVLK